MMKRSTFLALLAATGLSIVLSACTGFAPVYGDRSAGGIGHASFYFAEPSSRIEQIILNRLRSAFPDPARPGDPTLSVSANTASPYTGYSDAFPAGRPLGRRVTATVAVTQGDETLFSATRFADTSYQSGGVSPAEIAASTGASEQAAMAAAESLRIAVLAGYRPQLPAFVGTPLR